METNLGLVGKTSHMLDERDRETLGLHCTGGRGCPDYRGVGVGWGRSGLCERAEMRAFLATTTSSYSGVRILSITPTSISLDMFELTPFPSRIYSHSETLIPHVQAVGNAYAISIK